MNIKVNDQWVRALSLESLPEFVRTRVHAFYEERWEQSWGGRHILKGDAPGANSIQLISNDYLALANHPEIVRAMVQTLQHGEQSVVMSGAFLRGDNPQRRLEERLARWVGHEQAVLCQSGYAANVGLLQSVAGPSVPVYLDMSAHASLWEGVNSANAQPRPFRHNDLDHLARQVARHGPGVICVDSVYSTTGDVCDLLRLVEIGEQHGCVLIVDESHSLGTHGPQGAGLVRELGLEHRVHFVTASLAKAFCGRAGVIFCSPVFAEYFWCTSFPAIFSSCLLPYELAGLERTLELIQAADDRREQVQASAEYLREGLRALGYNLGASRTQIVSLESGTEPDTILLRETLERHDVFGSVFCAPATARNRALLRFSVNAAHTREELDRVIQVCDRIRDTVGMARWASTRRLQRRGAAVDA